MSFGDGDLHERVEALESLSRDALRMLERWDVAEWESLPEEFRANDRYQPEGNLLALQRRAMELGIEF